MTDFTKDELWYVAQGGEVRPHDLAAFALAQMEAREAAERAESDMASYAAKAEARAEAAEEERRRAVAQLIQLEGERIKWRARAEAAEDALARIRFLCGDHPGDENQREIMEATRLAAHKEDRDA